VEDASMTTAQETGALEKNGDRFHFTIFKWNRSSE